MNSTSLLKELEFAVIDLETTGGNHNRDKIIEIGIVKIKKLKIVDKLELLIKPGIGIPEFIQKLTSIKPSDVKDAKIFEEAADEVLEFIGDSILVAHNTSFDIPFLNSELTRMGKAPLKNKSLCTHLMTKYLIPNLLNSNLNYMSKLFNIKHKKAHRALDDAYASAELLLVYLQIFIEKNIEKVNHIYYPRNRFELDRLNVKRKDKKKYNSIISKIETPFVITIKGENGIILSSLPIKNSKEELDYLQELLKTIPWEMFTIRLYGHFIEAFIQFAQIFQKFSPETRGEILSFLWKTHLPKRKPQTNADQTLTISQEQINEKLKNKDFIILPHIVPEQFVITITNNPTPKTSLTFRYPGHKKKLAQFINSRISRMKKPQKNFINPLLNEFLNTYISDISKDKKTDIFPFKKSLPLKDIEDFYGHLDLFSNENLQKYNFPKEYI